MKKLTNHWIELAESDHKSAEYLFGGAHYPQAIYFLCLSIEKLLKALIIENTQDSPEKIHRLENLAAKTKTQFPPQTIEQLTDLSKHYSRVRYPDISQVSYNTRDKTKPIMDTGSSLYLWIRNQFTRQ